MAREFHFKRDEKQTIPERMTEFLNQFARERPGDWVPYNVLYKHVTGVPKAPNPLNQELHLFRKKMKTVKLLLRDRYNREVVSLPGVGVRATVDDVDKLDKVVPRAVTRFEGARKTLVMVTETLDPKNIPANHPMRKYLQQRVQPLLDMVNANGLVRVTQAALPETTKSTVAAVVDQPEKKAS